MGNRKKRTATWRWRSATRVVGGVVQPKNRHTTTHWDPSTLALERERSGRAFRHVLRRDDIFRFIDLLEDWDTLGAGLHTIRLARGSYSFGYWKRGVVAVCAFPKDRRLPRCYLDEYALRLFELIDARSEPGTCHACGKRVDVYFLSVDQVRAWQLLDVLCHELGHHHDAMTNRSGGVARGEPFALRFAEQRWSILWPRYQRAFRI
jgi:hypothetical protein